MMLAFGRGENIWELALGVNFDSKKRGKSPQENMHMRIGFAVDVNLQSLESLESLERLESLESLERLESLESLEILESLKILEKKSRASQTENVTL